MFTKTYSTKEEYLAMLGRFQDYLIVHAYTIENEAKAGIKEAVDLVSAINGTYNGQIGFDGLIKALEAYQKYKGVIK